MRQTRLTTALIVLIASISFGQAGSISTSIPGVVIHSYDVVAAIISLIACFIIIRKRIEIFSYPLTKPLLIFLGSITLSWFINYFIISREEFIVGSLYFFRWLIYCGVVFLTSYVARKSRKNALQLIKALKVSIVFFALVGVAQYIFFYDFRVLTPFGWDPHLHRLASTFLDPGYAGILIIYGLILYSPEQEKLIKTTMWWKTQHVIFILLLVVLGLTFSRASYISFVIATTVYSIIRKNLKFWLTTMGIFILVIFLAPKPAGEGINLQRTSTIYFRITNWTQAMHVIQANPLVGVGFNRYRYVQKDNGFVSQNEWSTSHSAAGVDNSLLFIWVTTGVIGLLAYGNVILSILKLIKNSLQLSPKTSPDKQCSLLLFSMLIATAAHGMFHNTWFYTPIMGILSIMIGITIPASLPSKGGAKHPH